MINIFNNFLFKIQFGLNIPIGLQFEILFDILNMYILYLLYWVYIM